MPSKSLQRSLRDELLNEEIFDTLDDARRKWASLVTITTTSDRTHQLGKQ